MMKRLFAVMFMAFLLSVCFTTISRAADLSPMIFIDGRELSFDVPPMNENGSILVPVRALFEALGATVMWNEATQTVTATKTDDKIILTVAQYTAYKNGTAVTLSVPPQVVAGRVLVPLRFVSEALGAQVTWNEEKQAIGIKSPPPVSSNLSPPANEPSGTLVTGKGEQPETAVQPTPGSSSNRTFSLTSNKSILLIIFLIMVAILLGTIFLRRSRTSPAEEQSETRDTTEDKYQEGINLIQQQNWAEAKLALISLSMDKYKESEPLCNYAAAHEQYQESNKPNAVDPYWAAFMADYYCRTIPDFYAGPFKEDIAKFKIECKNKLAALEQDPVAQQKHETAQAQQKKVEQEIKQMEEA